MAPGFRAGEAAAAAPNPVAPKVNRQRGGCTKKLRRRCCVKPPPALARLVPPRAAAVQGLELLSSAYPSLTPSLVPPSLHLGNGGRERGGWAYLSVRAYVGIS